MTIAPPPRSAPAVTLYGIRNCDTMKRARAWLDARGVDYAFHDYKTAGIDPATLAAWADACGWEALLNRAGTTFRKLPENARDAIDRDRALALMLAQPAMIRRPVLVRDGVPTIGFAPDRYAALFG